MADQRYKQTDYAWAAGFMDGEGCFCLTKPGRNNHPATRAIYIGASQLVKEPLEILHGMFGGHLNSNLTSSKKKVFYRWGVSSAPQARIIIPKLLPYLVNKKRDAEIVLEFSQMIKRRGRAANGKIVYSDDEIIRRLELIKEYEQIRGR